MTTFTHAITVTTSYGYIAMNGKFHVQFTETTNVRNCRNAANANKALRTFIPQYAGRSFEVWHEGTKSNKVARTSVAITSIAR